MTHIVDLINSAKPYIPFNQNTATSFLGQYSIDDQCALISALYIGRDHIHNNTFNPEMFDISESNARFSHTGCNPNWNIPPDHFPSILDEKNTNLHIYYDSFLRCAGGSNYDLSTF